MLLDRCPDVMRPAHSGQIEGRVRNTVRLEDGNVNDQISLDLILARRVILVSQMPSAIIGNVSIETSINDFAVRRLLGL